MMSPLQIRAMSNAKERDVVLLYRGNVLVKKLNIDGTAKDTAEAIIQAVTTAEFPVGGNVARQQL
jgi:hypothetical protein